MNTKIPLVYLALACVPALTGATDSAGAPERIKHRMVVILQLPAKDGTELVKFPVTFAAKGQTIEFSHREQSVVVSLTVGEISSGQVDLNYMVSSRSADDPLAPYQLRSYTEFDISSGRDTKSITVDGKEAFSITLEKEK